MSLNLQRHSNIKPLKMKKFFLPVFIISMLFAGFSSSCVKEVIKETVRDTTIVRDTIVRPAVYPIEGLWIGTYSVDGLNQGDLFYSMIIYPGGKIVTRSRSSDGNDYYSSGTWTLANNKDFSATIVTFSPISGTAAVTQYITATYSNTGVLTNGTWQDTKNPYSLMKGKFSVMQRVN